MTDVMKRNRAVFLDRDGVLNKLVYDADHGTVDSPNNPGQFDLMAGAGEAVRTLNRYGMLAVVVSNQPGIAKGKMSPHLLREIDEKMKRCLAAEGARLDAIYYCLHHPKAIEAQYREICDCRKPKPGLLHRASADLDISLSSSYIIGDGLVDIAAGRLAGCWTIMLGTVKCDMCRVMHEHGCIPNLIAPDILTSVKEIVMQEEGRVA